MTDNLTENMIFSHCRRRHDETKVDVVAAQEHATGGAAGGAAEGGGRGTIAWLDGHDPSSSSLGSREDLSRMTKNDQRSATIDWKISVKSSIIP